MSSYRPHTDHLQNTKANAIGDIFRAYGEQYIRAYKPTIHHIKFIRAVRVCKSPALGGNAKKCNSCGHIHYIYFSCGHARCPICQSVKREQWLDKMQQLLLDVPYVHLVTTLPRALHRLAKENERAIYSMIFTVTKQTIWKIAQNEDHLGATPGMVSVLHTWGSDMKYHVHVHSMLSFGGMDNQGNWRHPKHKKRYCRNSKLRHTYRELFLKALRRAFEKGELKYHENHETLLASVKDTSWTTFVSHPTMQSTTIEKYLARYINRIAVSNSRVKMARERQEVHLLYNDYKNQQEGQPAPKDTKVMNPLSFIHQLLSHLPPPYFQRTRRYGLHASAKSERAKRLISLKARKHGQSIRTTMEIITHLLKLQQFECEGCGGTDFTDIHLRPDKTYIFTFITLPKIRAPNRPRTATYHSQSSSL